MNWTLDQLEAFVTAVNHGSFSAAARKIGKAQSRVSTAITNLEADLGFELFDRSARLPVLTPEGKEMYTEAQAVLAQCQRMQSRAMTVSTGEEISLTVAMDEAVPILSFENFFLQIAAKYPLLKLTIINGSQDDIARWVSEKRADIGILFHIKSLPENLEFMPISQFYQSLIVSSEHPLATVSAPRVSELNRYRQLVIRERMGEASAKPISSNHWYVDSYYYITALVTRGVGWALVPEHLAKEEWYVDELVELSTEHIADSLLVEMGVVKRRDKGSGRIMAWMYDELSSMFKENT
ncbi:LysR family transcriptional regulator [Photobacterium alginatilyticum]|uniref:LysR family transcriptional regulator n=1 Tax=Photobacterium alginatilyticum TaxID=1775171 RepID=A0ABW9YR52_9GAMM|nr:LysR family transcriptional regulator [Photobacterium alginatilyticum]NBI56173.1 LysR family transcriptional regulator [Photobacterium alginatilyticum]